MKEKTLLYISIICSISGLILLYFISQNVELSQTEIGTITPDDIGKSVKICGEIFSKSVSKSGLTTLQLKDDTDKINVVIFNNAVEKLNTSELNKQDKICVIGPVSEYQNNLQIIPKEIERVE